MITLSGDRRNPIIRLARKHKTLFTIKLWDGCSLHIWITALSDPNRQR